ncbi:MAG TPA: hypothetical protein VMT94_09215 [Burkholderiales bacterium]|nr:hypothetical protein [Burkholderiales bacterium]
MPRVAIIGVVACLAIYPLFEFAIPLSILGVILAAYFISRD